MPGSGKNLIAAGHRATAEAAAEALDRGGNAFDGAVAGVFAALIAESTLTSAGGGGYFLAFPAGCRPTLFDFFVNMPRAPVGEDIDFFPVDVDFGTATQQFHIGKAAAAVPGTVPGLIEVQSSLGRLELHEVLQPAIRLARKGVELNHAQSYLIEILSPILCHTAYGKSLFSRKGNLLGVGDRFSMPDFGEFLEALGEEGLPFWTRGEAGRMLVEWSRGGGGMISLDDLEEYHVARREPLRAQFESKEVLLNPPPAQSGLLVQVTLSMLDSLRLGDPLRKIQFRELLRSFALTNRMRLRLARIDELDCDSPPLIDHPSFPGYLSRFLHSEEWSDTPEDDPGLGSTTHLSVLDSEGSAASVTTTNGEGCGYFVPQLGFMLNNMLGEKDLNPDGYHRYAPGVRLGSMVAPTIVLEAGSPCLVTGSSGSNRIRSALVQLLVNYFHLGLSLEESTQSSRFHLEGRKISIEPGCRPTDLREIEDHFDLELWTERNLFFGGVNSVSRNEAVADQRRTGYALIC